MIALALSQLASIGTLTAMWLAGSKRWWAWLIAFLNQFLWFVVIALYHSWFLLPLETICAGIFGWNLLRWKRNR